MLWPDEGEEEGDEDCDCDGGEAKEQEVGGSVEVHPEYGQRSGKETHEGGSGTDAWEEDAHEDEGTNGS